MSKKLPIIVDGLGLVDGHFSGIGQYILGILKGMDQEIDAAIVQQKPYRRVKVIIPYNTRRRFKSFNFKHVEYVLAPLSLRIFSGLWSRNKLPPIDVFFGRGLYLFPRFVSMPLLFSKSAVIVYDISYELHREYSDEGNARFLSNAVTRSIGKTNAVITISENAKKEILEFYKIPSSKVSIATPATDSSILYRRTKKEIEQVKDRYGIEGEYILALSNLEPRKNLETLVEAYCNLPAATRETVSLLLVGVSGWKTDKLFTDIIERVKDGFHIIRPSKYVDDDDKAAIISGAKMLVYPSHYEGFGMPPVEALACGTPVIAANNSSLPEAVGSAGTLLDSTDTAGFTKEIQKLLDSPSAQKSVLVKGPEHARKFSWKKSARTIIDTMEAL